MAKTLEVKVIERSPEFIRLLKRGYSDALFSNVRAALSSIAQIYQKTWRSYAYGQMAVPGSKPIFSSGPYARSIQIDDSKPLEKSIFTDYPPHKYIEDGHPEIDLKPGLLSGPQARQGKNGPYNIVSFRHLTPDSKRGQLTGRAMSQNLYNFMRSMTDKADQEKSKGLSHIGGRSVQLTAGRRPENRSYEWGQRLDAKLGGPRKTSKTGYQWKTGKRAGMVRMESPSGQKETRTQYRTFRVVSARSDPRSWIVPAADPIPIRQAVVDFVDSTYGGVLQDMLKQAIKADIS